MVGPAWSPSHSTGFLWPDLMFLSSLQSLRCDNRDIPELAPCFAAGLSFNSSRVCGMLDSRAERPGRSRQSERKWRTAVNTSTWGPTAGTITPRWAQTYRENMCHSTCTSRETCAACSWIKSAACGNWLNMCTADRIRSMTDLRECHERDKQRRVMSYKAACFHERLAAGLASSHEAQVCSGTTRVKLLRRKTKGTERQVKHHDSIRLY